MLVVSPVRKSVLPAIDNATGVAPPAVPIMSAMRPPHPEGAVRLLMRMPCCWRCWSSCEKRLGGAAPLVLYVVLSAGLISEPTLNSVAILPLAHRP